MSVITTVRGDIAPEDLGYTSVHEHLNADGTLMRQFVERYTGSALPAEMGALRVDNLAFLREFGAASSRECESAGDVDFTTAELGFFKQVGGNAVCDASPLGMRGDVRDLKAASERADVHVLFATGLYVAGSRPEGFDNRSEDDLRDFFTREVVEGVGDTGLRPGLLKCGLSAADPAAELPETELITLRALGRVSAATGLSLHVHTSFPMSHAQVLQGVEVALATGMSPDRLVMIHMDSFLRPWDALTKYVDDMSAVRNVSTELQRKVLDQGVNIGFDSWSATTAILPDDYDRLKGLVDLLRAGNGDRIVLGHDTFTKAHSKTWGYYGFTRFPQFIPPMLAQLGFADEVYRKLVVDNPARILSH
ncbi:MULTISPECIES: phosphotriesterase family protein [unclassified Streptosporangium]|uniref:phosphotriesterase family protein n=1 Tax=Streptosporangium sp. NPDC005286 TaxID=3154463 RepID=UPI0033ABD8F1